MTFASLGLSPALAQSTVDRGFGEPTPVQVATIPVVLRGRDVWASAQTGSGKTAAFVLPILEQLGATDPGARRRTNALVLVPTRELAAQVAGAFESLGRVLPAPPKVCVAIGGVSINPQMLALRGGADVVVATPGRLLDLVDSSALALSSVGTLVIDEADRLLSGGFADELSRVIACLPTKRQTLLFSATFPAAVQRLAASILVDPAEINVDFGAPRPESVIAQRAIEVDAARRTMLLRHLLDTHGWPLALVFVASRYTADHVAAKLARAGFAARALHGELTQGARTEALEDFKSRRIRILVATDLAARGLDIDKLPVVVNYDLPRSAADYVHRIGRTGRASETGVAVSFVTAESTAHFALIESRHALSIPRERLEGFEPTDAPVLSGDPSGGVKGRRKSKKDKAREAAARDPGSSRDP